MSTEIKKYEITILGESYTLVSDQGERNVQLAACKVNESIQEIMQKAPHLEQKKIIVLTALKIASMLTATEQSLEDMKDKSQTLLDRLDRDLAALLLV